MKLRVSMLLIALVVVTGAYSQKKGIRSISNEESVNYMKYLSSDDLQGRRTGSEGNNAAAEYINAAAEEMGLKPLPGRRDMFQTLDYLKISVKPDSSIITIRDSTGKSKYTAQVKPMMAPSDKIQFSGDVVFAGYGYLNSEMKYNDFEGISLKDRIVIVMTRNPDFKGSGMPEAKGMIDEMTEARKLPMILMQRPKAILFVKDPALKSNSATEGLIFSQSYQVVPQFKKQISFSFNAYNVSEETVNMLLMYSGETLETLQERIAETKRPVSFIVHGVTAEVCVSVEKDSVTSSNIAGYIEGSDPVLKDECVIYTAHYDHSGIDGSGNVLNGANDNASGAIGLLNVARAFSSLEEKPLRSIVFLWTTGEEEGLHGSSYYVDHPLFPLEKTVVNINFDMIGRSRMASDVGASLTGEMDITGADTIKIVSARESTGVLKKVLESCIENGLYPIDEGKGSHFSGSDHFPFFRKGIPAVFFFTGLHHDYHKSTDDFEFIDFEKLVKVSRAGFLAGYRIANDHDRPVIDNPSK
jgi:hypothetical protein